MIFGQVHNTAHGNRNGGIYIIIGITMLKVSSEHEVEAYNSIADMEKVKDVYRIAGEFQFFVIVQAETKGILHRLLDTMRNIHGVIGIAKVLISTR